MQCSYIKTFRKPFTYHSTTIRLCETRDLSIDQVKTAFSDGTDDQLLLSTILKRLLVKHVHIAAISTPLRPESWGPTHWWSDGEPVESVW